MKLRNYSKQKCYKMTDLHEISGVSRQSLYKHERKIIKEDIDLSILRQEVDDYRSLHPGCGLKKLYHQLEPCIIGRDKFIEHFKKLGYCNSKLKNYTKTTIPSVYKFPNLIEGSIINGVNQVWQTDITYFYVQDRFYYLSFIIDVYSRKIVGYDISDSLKKESSLRALKMALKSRKGMDLSNLIHHSDRGTQYTSKEYTNVLKGKGISISMGLKAQDNAYAERINGIIKNEYLRYYKIEDFKSLCIMTKKSVNNYNNKRKHHSLNLISPNMFEQQLSEKKLNNNRSMLLYSENYKDFKALQEKIYSFETSINSVCPLENIA